MALRRTRSATLQRSPRPTPRPYTLRGLLYCGICGRKMQGGWNNGAVYYRCVFLTQYAARNKIDHPRAVYLREDQLLPSLDRWLAAKFGAGALPQTVRELQQTQDGESDGAVDAQARREIATCDAKLRAHRAALEAGADPKVIAGSMGEVRAQRAAAETRLGQGTLRPRLTAEEITRIVSSLRDLISVLANADSADKAEIYGQLGLALKYHPCEQKVRAEARAWEGMYVSKCPRAECTPKPMPADWRVPARRPVMSAGADRWITWPRPAAWGC